MAAETSTPPTAPLPRGNPLALLADGRRAFAEVAGLRAFVWRGLALNYLLFAVLGAVALAVIYQLALAPLIGGLAGWRAGDGLVWAALSYLLEGLVWLAGVFLLGGTLVLAALLTLAMMGVWFEALAGRIVAHWRKAAPDELSAFSLRALLAGLGRSLKESLWLLLLALAALLLGLIPVVGVVLVVAVDAYLMGHEVRAPYLTAREELGDSPRDLRRRLGWWTMQTGLVPVLLAAVPVLGWVLLPWAMVTLVAGVAWQGERAAASTP